MRYFVICLLLAATAANAQRLSKRYKYEQVSFEDMIHRYLHRDGRPASEVEGVYSVSCIITKSKRNWITGRDVVRVIERKDNYARVAIMKETLSLERDFIEVSMSSKDASRYPVVGELAMLADGSGYVYRHVEPDSKIITFSMLLTHPDLLEGQFSQSKRRKIITTRLSYFKLYPKISKGEVVTSKD